MARVLIVDDDPVVLVLVEHALAKAGHQVWTSEDATEVSRWVIERSIDALILDVVLPDTSGFELLSRLRQDPLTGGLPILILSSRAGSEDRVHGLREGADDYLAKPFSVEELVIRIERLVAQGRSKGDDGVGADVQELERSIVDRQVVGRFFLGRYQALEMVGEGAMGMVFRGWDPRLKRPVALKTLRLSNLVVGWDRPSMISNLLQEAITVAKLSHPNLVAVYDVAQGKDTAFIAMEYVNGISLAACLKQEVKLPPGQVIALGQAVAKGLGAAHRLHVTHHDVKPGNVLLAFDGGIKVTDFGVAHLGSSVLEEEHKVFGTPGYLPPETLMSEGYGEAGDFFGLGAMLYQCLVGQLPFVGRTIPQVVLSTVRDPVEPPSSRVHGISAQLDELIMQLLVKDPKERLSSADEIVERFESMEAAEWTPPAVQSVDFSLSLGDPEDFPNSIVGRGQSCKVSLIDPTVPLDQYLVSASKQQLPGA